MEKTKLTLALEKASNLVKFFTQKITETEVKFESVKVKDSDSILEYSELKVGADVSISGTDGSTPAKDGSYVLINGAEIVVKEGKIEAVTKEADEVKEEVKEDEKLAEVEEPKEVAKDASADLSEIHQKIGKIEETLKAIMEVLELQPSADDVKEFNSKVEKLSKVPTQKSVDNRVEIIESELEKFTKLAEKYSK